MQIQQYENTAIRTVWDEGKQEWFFSVVDVVSVLTDSIDYSTGRKYWNKLNQRLKSEGNKLVTNCHQLKMPAADGKLRLTNAADTAQFLRIIQSIPSPKRRQPCTSLTTFLHSCAKPPRSMHAV